MDWVGENIDVTNKGYFFFKCMQLNNKKSSSNPIRQEVRPPFVLPLLKGLIEGAGIIINDVFQ